MKYVLKTALDLPCTCGLTQHRSITKYIILCLGHAYTFENALERI